MNILALALIAVVSKSVAAFDTSTHAAMTAAAAGKSQLGLSPSSSPLLRSLGVRDGIVAFDAYYIDIGPQLETRVGRRFENDIMSIARTHSRGSSLAI